jgi:hypothetical protein
LDVLERNVGDEVWDGDMGVRWDEMRCELGGIGSMVLEFCGMDGWEVFVRL